MCDYCDPEDVAKFEHEPIAAEGEDENHDYLYLALDWENNLELTYGWIEMSVPINYCPMCGRKLDGDHV